MHVKKVCNIMYIYKKKKEWKMNTIHSKLIKLSIRSTLVCIITDHFQTKLSSSSSVVWKLNESD